MEMHRLRAMYEGAIAAHAARIAIFNVHCGDRAARSEALKADWPRYQQMLDDWKMASRQFIETGH